MSKRTRHIIYKAFGSLLVLYGLFLAVSYLLGGFNEWEANAVGFAAVIAFIVGIVILRF